MHGCNAEEAVYETVLHSTVNRQLVHVYKRLQDAIFVSILRAGSCRVKIRPDFEDTQTHRPSGNHCSCSSEQTHNFAHNTFVTRFIRPYLYLPSPALLVSVILYHEFSPRLRLSDEERSPHR